MKQNRRESRKTAFCLLFEWSFKPDETLEDVIKQAELGHELEVDEFGRSLCARALEHVDDLDKLIEKYSDSWKLSRLSRVTLAALRLAFCEMELFDDIPAGATINEAVELVKTYGTQDEAAYINGILGTFVREKEAEKSEAGG